MKSTRNALVTAIVLPGAVLALQDGIGLKPHMGWSSWNVAQCDAASAKYALDTANKFVSLGLKDLGYQCKPTLSPAPSTDGAGQLTARARHQH